jgi:bifunctional non-homologous end joining protein LigD
MPAVAAPMLCTLTKEPIDDPAYLFEIKWDGYRIISYIKGKNVRLGSRGGLDYTSRYPRIAAALTSLGHDAVIDGEAVVFNAEGAPDFDALQLYNGHQTDITYCVFDLLWIDGYSLMDLPLTARKQRLKELIGDNPALRLSDSFDDGPALYQEMLARNLEGIVAKQRDSAYHPGERGNAWLKTPTRKRQEFVIGGWAESDKSRSFRSLLFGAYNGKSFEWIGRSGGGYKEREMPAILKKLESLETDHSPFANKVLDTKGARIHWVKPKLVANFEFATWTKTGRIRKPATFLGFRNDKKPTDVVREIPKPIPAVEAESHRRSETGSSGAQKKKRLATTRESNWPTVEAQPMTDPDELTIGDCTVEAYAVDRRIWKGVTKARLLEYYHSVSSFILPYLRDRPQSLHLKLINAGGPGLYIKDMEGRQPECAEIFRDKRRHPQKGKHATIDYLVCNNEATLLWMVNLGCVEINPWNSRRASPENPDYLAIDLDPTNKNPAQTNLDRLLDTAIATKAWCDRHKIKAFAKTSGQTGMHFFIPVAGIDYSTARQYAERICAEIQTLTPDSATIETAIAHRHGKVYVDPSQNDYADTLAAAYSVRPFHIPTVSAPLEWKEINRKLDPLQFTIDTIHARLKRKGDLFADVTDKKIAVANRKILRKILAT